MRRSWRWRWCLPTWRTTRASSPAPRKPRRTSRPACPRRTSQRLLARRTARSRGDRHEGAVGAARPERRGRGPLGLRHAHGPHRPGAGRRATGKAAGFPAAAGELVVWAAWAGRRGAGPPQIEAYDTASTRRWTAAEQGRDPRAAGESVIWVEPDGDGPAVTSSAAANSLTDEEYTVKTGAASATWRRGAAGRLGSPARRHGRGMGGAVRRQDPLPPGGCGNGRRHRPRPHHLGRNGRTALHRIFGWTGLERATVLCKVRGSASSSSSAAGMRRG